ncbi:MAG: zf-HC2 domain-containing protein [Candidatus Baltobacteraceae bacterium]
MNDHAREHLGDDLELYVLGLLDRGSAARVEAHAAGCASCLGRLGEAEGVLATLAADLPARKPPAALADRLGRSAAGVRFSTPRAAPRRSDARVPALLAVAFVFALAFGLAFAALLRERSRTPALDPIAIATIVHGHFSHATMVVDPRAAPLAAKVLYARAGGWIAVLVDHPAPGLAVFATVAGREVHCGTVRGDGSVGSAFARLPGRAERVELRLDARTVASATLVYPK